TTRPFQWNPVAGATGYYLYVGTSSGAEDLVNSGTTQSTTWNVPALPTGRTLYARIWVQTANGYNLAQTTDITFTAATRPATLTSPVNGQQNVAPTPLFQWTPMPSAAAYYLYVGTAPGLKDLIDTGEIQSTSYQPAAPLPPGTPLYARIFTEYGASWYHPYADVQFSINSAIPQITYPKNGGV